MSPRGTALGLDYGTKRIGVPVSDPDGVFAFPADTLVRSDAERDLEALRALIREREVTRVVVGLPIHMDGRKGPEAEAASRFAERLAEATGLPVDLLDERWTTVEAERALLASGSRRGRRRRTEVVDSVAASILLRTWLERERGGDTR